MKILGLNLGYMATASIYVDGSIVACSSQERYSRKKNDESYPKDAIEFCLKQAGILDPKEVDIVAIGSLMHDVWHRLAHYYSEFSLSDRLNEQHIYWKPKLYEGKEIVWHDLYKDRLDYDQYPGNWKMLAEKLSNGYYLSPEDQVLVRNHIVSTISDHIGINPDKIIFVDHHQAHAAYAYYASPFRDGKTLVLTLDAFGDGNSASISIGEGNKLTRIKTISHNDFQVARIYRYITLLMGMKPDEHEFKVMGLAPYCKPKTYQKAYEVFSEIMYVDGLDFRINKKPKDLYIHFRERLEGVRFDGIAGGLQKYVEDLIMEWVGNVVKHFGIHRIVLAGGVAMNIKAIQKIKDMDCVDQLFVPPSPGDESLCMGAAYHCASDYELINPLESAYLGDDVSDAEVASLLSEIHKSGVEYEIIENVKSEVIAQRLASGRVLGRCSGRMEFGARSLGNRAIIADARNSEMIKIINEKIKNRDFWMPFAPAILRERSDKYLINPKSISSPFMTVAFDTHKIAEVDLSAGIHPADSTARPQFVDSNTNPKFHELISEFENITSAGGVLNTSFNLHGEPIVRTPRDAYRVFVLTDIDDLLIGNTLIGKV